MIFIDTGAFLARFLQRDEHHAIAVAAWKQLLLSRERCVTSNFVLDETLTFLGREADYRFAAGRGREILGSSSLSILRPDEIVEAAALDVFEKFADQEVSFTDCVSFVLMKTHRVKRVFTFDRHFALAGFHPWPAKS